MSNQFSKQAAIPAPPAVCKPPPPPVVPPVPYDPAILTVRMQPFWGNPPSHDFESYVLKQYWKTAGPVYVHALHFALEEHFFNLYCQIRLKIPENLMTISCYFSESYSGDSVAYTKFDVTPPRMEPFNTSQIHASKLPPPGWTMSFYLWAWDLT